MQETSIQLLLQKDFLWPTIFSAYSLIRAVLEYVLGCHWDCSASAEFLITDCELVKMGMQYVVPCSQPKDDEPGPLFIILVFLAVVLVLFMRFDCCVLKQICLNTTYT